MIFKESRNLKIFISRLLFGVYFIALFSQYFHNHGSEDTFKGLNFKKTECKLLKDDHKENAGDCLVCHFLVTGNTLISEEFVFLFRCFTQEVRQIIILQEKIWSHTKFSFRLRGPPAIF